MSLPDRPLTVLIAALGGEGGGVLADWIIAAATARDYPVQGTSIPGVAQRTGATTYYIEIYPVKNAELGGRRPVMTLTPSPGWVDVMVASELLEAGRAMQNGYVTPERTTLVASTHRVYTIAEKMQMGDGRFDTGAVLGAGRSLARHAILFDMQALANAAGTVISAVMFGALCGSGALPLSRADCEAAIRAGGKGAEASLKGFAAGFAAVSAHPAPATPDAPAREPQAPGSPAERVRQTFPAAARDILHEGAARCADFQDTAYAHLYLTRLEPVVNVDRAPDYRLSIETGRFLALWMCYEDVVRVADLKTRASRLARVRDEVQAKPGEPLHVIEFLKPGVDELAALLPAFIAGPLRRLAERTGLAHRLNVGMQVRTTSVSGFLLLRLLAWLRPLRPATSRWREEQALIGRWLATIAVAAKEDHALGLEVALCGRLIKGYGETQRRGKANFLRILDTLVEGVAVSGHERVAAIRQAREAALADPEGRRLEQSLQALGITPLPPQARPLRFVRTPRTEGRKSA